MKFKEYEMPDGKKAVFEYDESGVGKITLECMDMLMGLINNRKTEPTTEDCSTVPTISKMEQVDKDINVRSKDEPQTCSVNGRPYDCGSCEHFKCTADEPQTEDFQDWKDRMWAEAVIEPQTDCNGCKFVGAYDTEFPCANCSRKTKDYYAKDEPQTERSSE